MSSTIYLTATIRNAERRFGSADAYVPARVVYADGTSQVALFTPAEIGAATARDRANPEDGEAFLRYAKIERWFRAAAITIAAVTVSVSAWALLT